MCDKKLHVVAAQFVLFKSLRISDFLSVPEHWSKRENLLPQNNLFRKIVYLKVSQW